MITSAPASFALVSLGCPKNQVDSEHLVAHLKEDGFISTSPDEAEIIIINTCAFIDDAKKESIETILEASQKGKKLLVFGCLAERYKEELKRDIPEVDYFFGLNNETEIRKTLKQIYSQKTYPPLSSSKITRERLNPSRYAYLKISEGCDRQCSFCIIPSLRGTYKSVKKDDILREAHELVRDDVKELIIVAQESTFYGKDLAPKTNLSELVHDLSQINELKWIRILYGHPLSITDEIIETMASHNKVVNYLDIPFQHSEKRILKLMNRRGDGYEYLRLIDKIRAAIPDIVLRTTFIVGFPGEDERDFERLLSFVQEAQFDRLGAFTYSPEEGTPAASLPEQVQEELKQERLQQLMETQEDISLRKNQTLIGTQQTVMIDEIISQSDHDIYIGRYYGQTPDVDGITVVRTVDDQDREGHSQHLLLKNLCEGDTVEVKIIGASEHDLEGYIR
jgi:ribosomal protein S12 methylthiotransferase